MSKWPYDVLGNLCNLITDGKHGDCTNEEGSGYYFISAKDVNNGRINYDNARQITESDFQETHRRTDLKSGDILLTNSGTIGRLAIASDDDRTVRTTLQKSVAVLKPKTERMLSPFLYYALSSVTDQLVSTAGGAAQKNLLLGDLKRFQIVTPPLALQREIASILSIYDDLIENNRRRMALLEDAARQVYQEWFVRLRFPGYEHTRIVDGVPEGWEKKNFGEICYAHLLQ
jgi:type I restriction enzyme S subunit